MSEISASRDAAGCVLPLSACTGEAVPSVGGKAAGLGRLLELGFPVPEGFAVTTSAYLEAIQEIRGDVAALLSGGMDDAAERIRALVADVELPAAVERAILDAYAALGEDEPVAIRSSATAEDTADASFAGQQDTYLWVRGAESVKHHIRLCWASLFTARAIAYRGRLAYDEADLAMAVVVQRMVDAAAAGVALSLDPRTGGRETIYLEIALGLGEGVVRGDVPTDRVWVDKATRDITRQDVAEKDRAHRLEDGEVRIVDVSSELAHAAAITEDEARAVADLVAAVEEAFGRPMDVEWAIDSDRTVALLQARPETVWSSRGADEVVGAVTEWDPLHFASPAGAHWTTTNLGETAPGVLSPLAWTVWGTAGESAIRRAAHNLGVLDDDEVLVPTNADDRLVKAFFGRAAMQVEFLARLGDRMPGTTGAEAVRSILGEPPEDLEFSPTRHRWPAIARKLPVVFVRGPKWLRDEADRTERWWTSAIAQVESLDRAGAIALFGEAEQNFERTLALQTTGLLGVIQPLYDALGRLCAKTGVGDVTVLSSGYSGLKEVAVVGELWRAAHGQTTVQAIVAEYGFHGPLEGELASRVWREDPSILEGLLDQYRDRPDPRERDAALRRERVALEQKLVASVPVVARPGVRALLALCEQRIPLRGVTKRSFLQSIDVARAAARRFGTLLVEDEVLDAVDDVFYLTATELTGALPDDVADLVRRRRARREQYRQLVIPASWTGDCTPIDPALAFEGDPDVVTGIGVSPGIVEGTVRVLESSNARDLERDEILVAPATDPSWSSIMFISSALIVDIGGALSHASMVARELGIPCVVNTGNATRRLKTGDRVRVDGGRGVVELLERRT